MPDMPRLGLSPRDDPALLDEQRLELVGDLVGEPTGLRVDIGAQRLIGDLRAGGDRRRDQQMPGQGADPIVSAAPGIRVLLAVPDMVSIGICLPEVLW